MSVPSQSPTEGRHSEAVLGPFTIRDLTLFVGVLILFVGTLLPLIERNVLLNLWNAQNIFFVAVGFLVPAAAAGLFAWRRLEPQRHLSVGSLSVDQFASVASVLCAAYFFVFTVTTLTPGAVVGLLGAVALLASTTFSRLIPAFAPDFADRPETPAHVVARDAARPTPRSAAGRTRTDEPERSPAAGASGMGAAGMGAAGAAAAGAAVAGAAGSGTAPAGAASAGAAPAGAANAGAWGSSGAGTWGIQDGDTAADAGRGAPPRPQEAWARPAGSVDASGPAGPADAVGTGQTRDSSAAVPTADDVASPDSASAAGLEADALASSPMSGEGSAAEGTQAGPHASSGTERGAGTAAESSPTAAAPRAVDPTLDGGTYAQADGEAYGAPEPVATHPAADERAAQDEGGVQDERGAQAERAAVGEPAVQDERAAVGSRPSDGWSEPAADVQAAGAGRETAAVDEPVVSAPATAVFPASSGQSAHDSGRAQDRDIEASRPYGEPEAQYEAFWFAVSQPRMAIDPTTGQPAFPLEPGQWILALQDRGHEFVVQSTDGRVGVLRDLSGIERA
jgi:hypothetical protein